MRSHQPNGILGDIHPLVRTVVAEAVVVQPRLAVFVLPLITKRTVRGFAYPLAGLAVAVQLRPPHRATRPVVQLQGRAQVVTHHAVALGGGELSQGGKAVLLEEEIDYVKGMAFTFNF